MSVNKSKSLDSGDVLLEKLASHAALNEDAGPAMDNAAHVAAELAQEARPKVKVAVRRSRVKRASLKDNSDWRGELNKGAVLLKELGSRGALLVGRKDTPSHRVTRKLVPRFARPKQRKRSIRKTRLATRELRGALETAGAVPGFIVPGRGRGIRRRHTYPGILRGWGAPDRTSIFIHARPSANKRVLASGAAVIERATRAAKGIREQARGAYSRAGLRTKHAALSRRPGSRISRLQRIDKPRRDAVSKLAMRRLREGARQAIKSVAPTTASHISADQPLELAAIHVTTPADKHTALSVTPMLGWHFARQTAAVVGMAKSIMKAAMRSETVRGAIRHEAVANAARRAAVLKGQYRLAAQAVRAMRGGSRLASRSTTMKTMRSAHRGLSARSSSRRTISRNGVLFTPQFAQIIAMLRMQNTRSGRMSSASDGASIKQASGKARPSGAMAMGAVSAQPHAMFQTKAAAPFASARGQLVAGQRVPGHIDSNLACPVPVMQQQNGRILSPDAWIDGSHYELIDHIEPEVAEEFVACVLKQLQKGPALIADDDLRIQANACVQQTSATIDRETWEALLKETLVRAVHYVLLFSETGLRGAREVCSDASMILDMDSELFASWEEYFGASAIAENLKDDVDALENRFPNHEDLANTLDQEVLKIAVDALAQDGDRNAYLHAFETNVQWFAVRYCVIEDGNEKVRATTKLVVDLARKDRAAAARLLTMIVRHSVLNKRKMASDVYVRRWIGEELRQLIIQLCDINAAIVTDTYFRSQLTSWENSGLNKLITDANQMRAMKRMKKLDPDCSFEDFFEVLEESGRADDILDDIAAKMACNFNKLN